MTRNLILLCVCVCIFVFMAFVGDHRKGRKKVIFFGDSITQMGIEPGGYISIMKEMIAKEGLDNFDLYGAGIGGNKVYDLFLRMNDDVVSKSPDIVVIYEGVNDVWHKATSGTGTDADKYEKFYRAIIKGLLSSNIKVIVCTPAVIGEKKDCTNQQDGDLNKYANIIKAIAADYQLPVCDLRSIFLNYETEHNTENAENGILTTDGVHLNETGNKLVAAELWNAIKNIK